jgi:hypothetical protein
MCLASLSQSFFRFMSHVGVKWYTFMFALWIFVEISLRPCEMQFSLWLSVLYCCTRSGDWKFVGWIFSIAFNFRYVSYYYYYYYYCCTSKSVQRFLSEDIRTDRPYQFVLHTHTYTYIQWITHKQFPDIQNMNKEFWTAFAEPNLLFRRILNLHTSRYYCCVCVL